MTIQQRIDQLIAQGTPESLAEAQRLLKMLNSGISIGSITSGGNTNIGKTIIIKNGRRER